MSTKKTVFFRRSNEAGSTITIANLHSVAYPCSLELGQMHITERGFHVFLEIQ